jgi:hypothetical protein
MSDSFVIATADFTMGILASRQGSLRFEALHADTLPLQNRFFPTPEAAQRIVEQLIRRQRSGLGSVTQVYCRPLF